MCKDAKRRGRDKLLGLDHTSVGGTEKCLEAAAAMGNVGCPWKMACGSGADGEGGEERERMVGRRRYHFSLSAKP